MGRTKRLLVTRSYLAVRVTQSLSMYLHCVDWDAFRATFLAIISSMAMLFVKNLNVKDRRVYAGSIVKSVIPTFVKLERAQMQADDQRERIKRNLNEGFLVKH